MAKAATKPTVTVSNSEAALRGHFQKLLDLAEERADVSDRTKDAKTEIKDDGYDVAVLDHMVKMHRKGLKNALRKRNEVDSVLDTYMKALGWNTESEPDEEAAP